MELQILKQEKEVAKIVNWERKKKGLSEIKLSISLTKVARVKSNDMILHDCCSHVSPKYGSPAELLKHFSIPYVMSGENIAAGQVSPEQVMDCWMNSPGHRANILNQYFTEIGVGYAEGGSYGFFWTQIFRRL